MEKGRGKLKEKKLGKKWMGYLEENREMGKEKGRGSGGGLTRRGGWGMGKREVR